MSIILKNCNLIEAERQIENKDILIEEEEIVQINENIDRSSDQEKDLDGDYVLPGLIDCHVHLVSECRPTNRHGDDEMRYYRVVQNMKKSLEEGITSMRDLNAPDETVINAGRAVEERMIKGPSIYGCGQGICATGGHFSGSCREADGPDEVVKAVREQIDRGASVIKLMATSSAYKNEGMQELTLEEMEAAVKASKLQGLPLAAHAEGKKGILSAIKAGIDSIEHAKFMDDEVAKKMVENENYWVPTCKPSYEIFNHPEAFENSKIETAEKMIRKNESSFDHALEHGVKIAFGTDAGTSFNKFGEQTKELELMQERGMDPESIIEAATINAADLLNIENKVGRIEEGYKADLIIVGEDPTDDISALREVDKVIKNGEIV
jgi:imidazolonepropionase-like amidohydrolase